MTTVLLLVRHAESDVRAGSDRARGLTANGRADARRLTEQLRQTPIDAVVSSPYARAVLTVQGIADERGLPVLPVEDLRERRLHGTDRLLPRAAFLEAVERSFADPDASLPGGESYREAQRRGAQAVRGLLDRFAGKTVAVGTHGNLLSMILQAWDARYDYAFWQSLTMPDVYRAEFKADSLLGVERLWT
ncbi:histidine phosphatase family protein [Paenibacillus glycinis]|uniref:Histidine phosphatase family protein n=1 Tax=Paenibacillus glycinis TaxID=2697035 RepID=A0ABW9XY00_9BACL|nr:histidine phosphatase family protein [Paenibacillus glycinis]NBD27514.1 histidine phosphatase family protein [Paenibacillus glycinis]